MLACPPKPWRRREYWRQEAGGRRRETHPETFLSILNLQFSIFNITIMTNDSNPEFRNFPALYNSKLGNLATNE